jgi:transposase InsO family protein
VQTVLRNTFKRWGRPLRFRVDNGVPWGSSGDLPPDLVLWLLGLGVETVTNPPRRPQDNGVVERSQGPASAGLNLGPVPMQRNCRNGCRKWT